MALTRDARALIDLGASAPERNAALAAVNEAVATLRRGDLVGLPTETVYGLAADADQPAAVAKVFAAKERPADHPLIVHVAGATQQQWRTAVEHYAHSVPDFAWALMEAFWPGPLTVILPRRPEVGAAAAGGQDSIGLRCPSHPVAQALLQAGQHAGVYGVAAPSANRFGRVSPTTAAHVHDEFHDRLSDEALLILDGGACPVGIESTIIDASRGRPVLMRPGMIGLAELERVAGQPMGLRDGAAPRASGTLESHYAPNARVRLMSAQDIQSALDVMGADARHIAIYSRSPVHSGSTHVQWRAMASRADACAQELFAVLRELDQPHTKLIWVENPPDSPEWDGVRDRLQRAAA